MTDVAQPKTAEQVESYYELTATRDNIWTVSRRSNLYYREVLRYERLLAAVPADAKRALDLGCGDGYLSVLLARRSHQVTALDLSRNRLDKFADKAASLGIRQVQAPGEETGLETGSFDAVVISEVVEHLSDAGPVLSEVRRLLAPGGTLVVCVPNREKIRHVTCPHCLEKFSPDGHLHSFSAESLSELLRASGFEPVRSLTFRNSRAEKLRGAIVNVPYGFWIRWLDGFFSRVNQRLDRYLAVAARQPGS